MRNILLPDMPVETGLNILGMQMLHSNVCIGAGLDVVALHLTERKVSSRPP